MTVLRKNPNIYSRKPRRGDVEALMRRINALEAGIVGGSGYAFDFEFGTNGASAGEFQLPIDVDLDSSGNIYVADSSRQKVIKFNPSGVYQSEFTPAGSTAIRAIGVDPSDQIHCMRTFDVMYVYNASGTLQFSYGTRGSGSGQFTILQDITIDSTGTVYLANTDSFGNDKILAYNASGVFQYEYALAAPPSYIACDSSDNIHVGVGSTVYVYSGASLQYSYAAPLSVATHIDVDGSGNVHFLRTTTGKPEIYTDTGVYVGTYGEVGSGAGQITNAFGIDSDASSVYISDYSRDKVLKFTSSGSYSQTAFSRYAEDSTATSLGTPDGGVSVPATYALSDNRAWLSPQHIVDMRTAIEAMAANFTNPNTSNAYNFTNGSADNLYYNAMGDRKKYGGQGPRYTWTRTFAQMINTPTYDIDIGEIHECVSLLEAA